MTEPTSATTCSGKNLSAPLVSLTVTIWTTLSFGDCLAWISISEHHAIETNDSDVVIVLMKCMLAARLTFCQMSDQRNSGGIVSNAEELIVQWRTVSTSSRKKGMYLRKGCNGLEIKAKLAEKLAEGSGLNMYSASILCPAHLEEHATVRVSWPKLEVKATISAIFVAA